MSYLALYRKYRPTSFNDVKGQEHIVTTLKNQIKADRIGHAYFFCGTRGTGKTTVAKILAKAVNCENPNDGNACGKCESCKNIQNSMNIVEIDAASNNGVENIRQIIEDVSYTPTSGKYKVYIIDEVHMLSIGAFNALLKTLEEPPAHVIFILATTDPQKLPITILSRCQRYDFKRITTTTICSRLKDLLFIENMEVDEKGLQYIAKIADGSMRDALSLLDQCIAFNFCEKLTYEKVLEVLGVVDNGVFTELFNNIRNRNVLDCIDLLEKIVIEGKELIQFVADFTWYLRNMLLIKSTKEDIYVLETITCTSSETLKSLQPIADTVEIETFMRYIRIFSELSNSIKYTTQKRILIETTLIKICKPEMEVDYGSIIDRISQLEDKIKSGVSINQANVNIAEPQKNTIEKILPEAIPEDVKNIVEQWNSIVNNLMQPMKTYLKYANLSLGVDNKLIIVLEDGVQSDYFKTEDHKTQLEESISNRIEKKVEVKFQTVNTESEFNQNYVDITKIIHMEIDLDDSEITSEITVI